MTRNYKADPEQVCIGTHDLFVVGPDEQHPEERIVLVYKDTLSPPRWGLPGGTWGADPTESPVDTAARHMGVRLGVHTDGHPTVIGTDWVPAGEYPPGLNIVFFGGVITAVEAALMRPRLGSGYEEIRLLPVSQLLDAEIDEPSKLRIVQALRVWRAGRGFAMTEEGIPVPAGSPGVR